MAPYERTARAAPAARQGRTGGAGRALDGRGNAGSAAVSPRQATCLQAIRAFRAEHGVSPSRSELRDVLQLGKHSSVEKHLDGLARRNWIMVMPGVERGIVPLREGVPLYEVHAVENAQPGLKDHGRRPAEPTWIDCPALWEGLCEIPDLCLRMPTDDTEGRSVNGESTWTVPPSRMDTGSSVVFEIAHAPPTLHVASPSAVPGNRGVLTPYAGLALGEARDRTVRAGTRWQLGPDVVVGLEATRQTSDAGEGANELMLRAALRF